MDKYDADFLTWGDRKIHDMQHDETAREKQADNYMERRAIAVDKFVNEINALIKRVDKLRV